MQISEILNKISNNSKVFWVHQLSCSRPRPLVLLFFGFSKSWYFFFICYVSFCFFYFYPVVNGKKIVHYLADSFFFFFSSFSKSALLVRQTLKDSENSIIQSHSDLSSCLCYLCLNVLAAVLTDLLQLSVLLNDPHKLSSQNNISVVGKPNKLVWMNQRINVTIPHLRDLHKIPRVSFLFSRTVLVYTETICLHSRTQVVYKILSLSMSLLSFPVFIYFSLGQF